MLTVVHFNKNSFEANEFVDHGWVKWIWPSSSPKTGRVYSLQGQEKTWRDIHTTVFVESDVPSKVTVTEPFRRYGLIWCKRLKQTNRSPFWAVNKLRLSLEIIWCQWGMTWSDRFRISFGPILTKISGSNIKKNNLSDPIPQPECST